MEAWSSRGQLACNWPKFNVAADFSGKRGGVVVSAHAMLLNIPINDIIVVCDSEIKIMS